MLLDLDSDDLCYDIESVLQPLAANLTERVKQLEARLNWEMGPYHHPDNTLVISPSVRENIELAQQVVAGAPALAGWHFLPAKPTKVLKRLVMELPGITGASVCGDDWVYRLTSWMHYRINVRPADQALSRDIRTQELVRVERALREAFGWDN